MWINSQSSLPCHAYSQSLQLQYNQMSFFQQISRMTTSVLTNFLQITVCIHVLQFNILATLITNRLLFKGTLSPRNKGYSYTAIQLKGYCWEGVEFIQLVYCIIIYLSFLNCDYWTQELLVPVEKFTVRMPMVRLELATPGLQTQHSSH